MSQGSLDTGRIVAATKDAIVRPDHVNAKRPVLFFHAAAAGAAQAVGIESTFLPSCEKIVSAIADQGFTVACVTSQDKWGNATSMANAASALTYLRSALGQSAAAPIVVGTSMGSTAALRYAALNAVACVVGVLSIPDLSNAYLNNLGGNQANIASAWGVTAPAALPAGADPNRDHRVALTGKPIQLHYATDDTYSTNIAAFAAATGAQTMSLGATGHTDAAVAAADRAAILSFIHANA